MTGPNKPLQLLLVVAAAGVLVITAAVLAYLQGAGGWAVVILVGAAWMAADWADRL